MAAATSPGGDPHRGAAAGPPRGWLIRFAAALSACVLLAAGLTWFGVATLRDSRTGRTVSRLAPDEPGFEAFLEPTPTLAVALLDEGQLDSVAVLSLGADDLGGGVLLLPRDAVVGSGVDATTLAVLHAFAPGPEELRGAVEIVAGVGIPELVEVDEPRLRELVSPVAPIALDNPDDLPDFDVGPLALAAEEVGAYLTSRRRDESDLTRLARHELFWEAWLDAISRAGGGGVAGEVDTGTGRFLRGLAAGLRQVHTLPVTPQETPDGDTVMVVDAAERARLVASMVPFPTGTAFAPRVLVRLLDGTGDPEHVRRVAPAVVASEASVVVVGNADRFDYDSTQIRYHRPEERAAAERLQRDLGVGEVIEDVRPIDTFGVTIVLGTDIP